MPATRTGLVTVESRAGVRTKIERVRGQVDVVARGRAVRERPAPAVSQRHRAAAGDDRHDGGRTGTGSACSTICPWALRVGEPSYASNDAVADAVRDRHVERACAARDRGRVAGGRPGEQRVRAPRSRRPASSADAVSARTSARSAGRRTSDGPRRGDACRRGGRRRAGRRRRVVVGCLPRAATGRQQRCKRGQQDAVVAAFARVCQRIRSADVAAGLSFGREPVRGRAARRRGRARGGDRLVAAVRPPRRRRGAVSAPGRSASRSCRSSIRTPRSSRGPSSGTSPRCRRSTSTTPSAASSLRRVGRPYLTCTVRVEGRRVRLDLRDVLHVLRLLVVGGGDDELCVAGGRRDDDRLAVDEVHRRRRARRGWPGSSAGRPPSRRR